MARQRGKKKENKGYSYLTFSDGLFVERVSEPTSDSTPRVLGDKSPNKGDTVHEEKHKEISGMLMYIDVESHDTYGKSWNFYLDINDDPNQGPLINVVKAGYRSGYAANILKCLPNIDISDDIILRGYSFMPKGESKAKKGISVLQYDASDNPFKINPFYTVETPNGCPPWEDFENEDGVIRKTNIKEIKFLEEMVSKDILPNLPGLDINPSKSGEDSIDSESQTEVKDKRDLPF